MTIAERFVDHLHPWLAELQAEPGNEVAFWERVARERAPLIEPDPERPGHSLVTYVFPIDGEAKHVVVQCGVGDPLSNVMDRIAGTNVCHATFRYRDDVRTSYSFAPDMPPVAWRSADEAAWRSLLAFVGAHKPAPDPHHREFFASRAGENLPDNITSILTLPDAPSHAVVEKRADVPRGWINRSDFHSEVMGNDRRVWVYTPPGYEAGKGAYPILVAFDGGAALSLTPTHRILDNLIADGRVAPLVAVFVDNATDTSRNQELPCSEDFARFMETELLPWVRGKYAVSEDPRDGYVTGVSYGGLASCWMGFRLPHLFGNVISQSASLWWGPGYEMEKPLAAQNYDPEWLIDEYVKAPRLPLRFWMEIGLMEPLDRMIDPNRRMKAVLEAKGYDLTYQEPAGGHDHALWRGTFATALETMLPPR
ncbi:MAG TPA: alpha/beta hydrolase-fold protein [Caulobacteraceae bacterium]|jgi:enterochelin esterase family protein